ncbi:glycoside hydrolase family 27 protein [Backusella circina FSU 941]|nr:glycoside hydrolase family 27 protein [Backusella circina FSU 941]
MTIVYNPSILNTIHNNDSVPEWARKPILGFSTWSTQILDDVPGYGGKNIEPWFNQESIKEISDMMRYNMPNYEYINLDSGWCNTCDEYGRWIYRSSLFPSGLKHVAQYLKKNGHKLGVYLLPGIRKDAVDANGTLKGTQIPLRDIVQQRRNGNAFKDTTYQPDPDKRDLAKLYYESIAELFSEYGISFVKIDGCGAGTGGDYINPNPAPDNRSCIEMLYEAFHKFNIWVELSWHLDPHRANDWVRHSHGARVFIDIESYSTKTMTTSHRIFQRMTYAARWVGSGLVGTHNGFYVDLDAVLVGMTVNGKCVDGLDNDDVRLSYISFWAILSSVFCLGADPRMIPEKYLAWLNHPKVLNIQQCGRMARPVGSGNPWVKKRQIWWKTMPDGKICVGLFNAHTYPFMLGRSHHVKLDFKDIGCQGSGALLEDVWTGQQLGYFEKCYNVLLRPGQCQLLFLEKT